VTWAKSNGTAVVKWSQLVLVWKATPRMHATRSWYGIRATALQPTVADYGHDHGRSHGRPFVCRKDIIHRTPVTGPHPHLIPRAKRRARGSYPNCATPMEPSLIVAISLAYGCCPTEFSTSCTTAQRVRSSRFVGASSQAQQPAFVNS
jgi:hypothetical protein